MEKGLWMAHFSKEDFYHKPWSTLIVDVRNYDGPLSELYSPLN